MDDNAEPASETADTCEEARTKLIKLTSEYYSLLAQCKALAPDQDSQGDAGDIRNILLVDRLEEITQETKQLLPSIYPQMEIKQEPPASAPPRSRRPINQRTARR